MLIHRGSGVVNFAHAAIGLSGAYVFYESSVTHGIPRPIALLLGVGASAAIGVGFHLVVMAHMRAASMLARVVATLALLVVLQGVAILRYGPFPRFVPSMLPTGPFEIGSITVGADRIWILGIVLVLTAMLAGVYRISTFGIATSAVAENPRAAAALGVAPDRVAAANWAIGSALGGLAAILLVPITGIGSSNLTWLVIPVLAAAVVGRFSSFPLTVVGGLAIGVSQSLVTRFVETPGAGTAVPFLVATVVLLPRGSRIAPKDERFGRMPQLGTGRFAVGVVALAVATTLVCVWWVFPDAWQRALIAQLVVAVVLMSFVVVTGFGGQVSLAQYAFAGVGAMGASWLMFHQGWPFSAAAVVGAFCTVPIGIAIGLAGVRTRGVDLAILTLGFAISLPAVVFGNSRIMRRVAGRFDELHVVGIDVSARDHPARYATLVLIVLVAVGAIVTNLRRSRAGRRLIAVRTNERAAAAMGISVVGAKLYAFVLGGVIAGLGGVLDAFRDPIPSYRSFAGLGSVEATQFAVLGGVGSVSGPLVGSAAHPTGLGQRAFVLTGLFGDGARAAMVVAIAANLVLLAMLRSSPDGIAMLLGSVRRRLARAEGASDVAPPPVTDAAATATKVDPKHLRVEGLTVWFGGVHALDDVTFDVAPGEVVGLIGPNGAGKSTAIEAISGFVTPRAGTISIGGAALGRRSREARARAGLSRSFQSLELFDDLTVRENVLAACDRRDRLAFATNLVAPGSSELTDLAGEVVGEFGLNGRLDTRVSDLSYAERRMLAVARAMAGGPSVLLLDEPAAGLDTAQARRLGEVIVRIAREWGVAIVLVEHHVELVMRTCDRIYTLEFGRVIAHGTPSEIAADRAVISAYLGTRDGTAV